MSIDRADVALSADLLALLGLCAVAAHRIADGVKNPEDLAADLQRCLAMAASIADQTYDAMRIAT